jgi:putative AdoMet-dependent methyltransferase
MSLGDALRIDLNLSAKEPHSGELLKPGGAFVLHDLFFSCDPDDCDPRVVRCGGHGSMQRLDASGARRHLRDEYSTFTWLVEPMLQHAGFQIREKSPSDSRTYARYVCVTHE